MINTQTSVKHQSAAKWERTKTTYFLTVVSWCGHAGWCPVLVLSSRFPWLYSVGWIPDAHWLTLNHTPRSLLQRVCSAGHSEPSFTLWLHDLKSKGLVQAFHYVNKRCVHLLTEEASSSCESEINGNLQDCAAIKQPPLCFMSWNHKT